MIRITLARQNVREDLSNSVTTRFVETNFNSSIAATDEEFSGHYESRSTVACNPATWSFTQ